MNKLIIDNRTETLDDLKCLDLIKRIIKLGRISNNNKQYCYASLVFFANDYYYVYSYLNKKSDRFVIRKSRINAPKQ